MSDLIVPSWATDTVVAIETAVTAWNAAHKEHAHIRLVWGYADAEEAAEEAAEDPDYQQPSALLSFLDIDYELSLCKSGDPEAYDDRLYLYTELPSPSNLPLVARDLFDVLKCCEDNVQLSIVPAGRNEVAVTGVSTTLSAKTVTSLNLRDALSRLSTSCTLCFYRLNGKGDDHWGFWGGQRD